MEDRIQGVLDGILQAFESGDIGPAAAVAVFPSGDKPMAKWSYRNRLLCAMHGATDARGFRQWKEVNRWVRKGGRSFKILAPILVEEDGEKRCVGFRGISVFDVTQTEGKPLGDESMTVTRHPFTDVAERMGISVVPSFFDGRTYGTYYPGQDLIELHTDDCQIFLHELSHAVQDKLGMLKTRSSDELEISADLSATVLCYMLGVRPMENVANTYRYIARYAGGMSPHKAALSCVNDVGRILEYLMKDREEVMAA